MMTRFFVKQGYCIVSGLALGCDTVAHDECIKAGGKAIAVLPSPCDNPQPASNRLLADSIIESGGLLISEYGTGSPVTKYNFPRRDRIQSLLSDATVIIQANDQSGTMIAAKKSIQDGKRVAALSGNELTAVQDYIDETDIEGLSDFCNWIL
jgi:DNA processing protein